MELKVACPLQNSMRRLRKDSKNLAGREVGIRLRFRRDEIARRVAAAWRFLPHFSNFYRPKPLILLNAGLLKRTLDQRTGFESLRPSHSFINQFNRLAGLLPDRAMLPE